MTGDARGTVGLVPKKVSSSLWLVTFHFDRTIGSREYGDREQSGRFEIIVEATSQKDALRRCREHLERVARETRRFGKSIAIYVDGLIRLCGSFEDGMMVNWTSGNRPPEPHYWMLNLLPERGHVESEDQLLVAREGEPIEPFIEFDADDPDDDSGPRLTS